MERLLRNNPLKMKIKIFFPMTKTMFYYSLDIYYCSSNFVLQSNSGNTFYGFVLWESYCNGTSILLDLQVTWITGLYWASICLNTGNLAVSMRLTLTFNFSVVNTKLWQTQGSITWGSIGTSRSIVDGVIARCKSEVFIYWIL